MMTQKHTKLSAQLQRQPGAIRSRTQKLEGLISEPQTGPELREAKSNLEAEFHEAMLEIYRVAAEHGYYATRFKQLVHNRSGLGAARWLLTKEDVQEGLAKLWELDLLEHSTEALVLRERFHPLFTETERQEARRRLDQLGFFAEK